MLAGIPSTQIDSEAFTSLVNSACNYNQLSHMRIWNEQKTLQTLVEGFFFLFADKNRFTRDDVNSPRSMRLIVCSIERERDGERVTE